MELWPHFKQVLLSWSFDGVGKQFEYIRHPAKWNEVQQNLQKVIDKNIPNIHLDICYTVGIFNIYYMEEILEWRDSFKSDLPIYFNHVYTPEHFSCKVLPESIKSKIVEKYKNNTHPNYDIEKMNMFYSQVKYSDDFRGESFAETFPEFYELLKKYANAPEDF